MNIDDPVDLNIAEVLGATSSGSAQTLTLYIPNKDRAGKPLKNQRQWILEAANLLAHMGGGVTIMPPVEGGWLDEKAGKIIWEKPVLVYSHIKPDRFLDRLPQLRELLHRMGRETNQGEVAFEFDGVFYRVTQFDGP